MRPVPIAASIMAAAAVGVAAAWWVTARQPVTLASGTALESPRAIAAFRLTDQQGREFTQAALRGRWSLLFTGFTHCPDICPTTLVLLADLRTRLPDDALQVVFVSVDPERDTPDVLAAYVAHFSPQLTGVTGARADLEAFTSQLGLAQLRNPGVGDDYTVDHSTALVLIDPRARVAGYFRPPHDPAAIAADLAALTGGAG
ncbi:MAG TPA: SCO family protein [Steroidobacteraceae bacterium]